MLATLADLACEVGAWLYRSACRLGNVALDGLLWCVNRSNLLDRKSKRPRV